MLNIQAEENTKELSSVDPVRLAVAQEASQGLLQTSLERTMPQDPYAKGSLRWCRTMFPTNAYAQDANMSLSDFEDFVYRAYFLDDENPVARWQELSRQQERLGQWLGGKHTVQLRGQDTEPTLSIDRRTFL